MPSRGKKRSIDPAEFLSELLNDLQPWKKTTGTLDDFIQVVESLFEISSLVRNSGNVSELFDKCSNNSVEGTSCQERWEFVQKAHTTIGLEADLTTIEEIENICKLNFIERNNSNR